MIHIGPLRGQEHNPDESSGRVILVNGSLLPECSEYSDLFKEDRIWKRVTDLDDYQVRDELRFENLTSDSFYTGQGGLVAAGPTARSAWY